jgi:hypothetical protein
MPFESQAQRRKFAELLVQEKISNQTFEEWNRGRKTRTNGPLLCAWLILCGYKVK